MSYVSLHNIVVNPDYTDAWMAGLFDGEGSIIFDARHPNATCLQVTMNDFDVVRQFSLQAGCGRVREYAPYAKSNQTYPTLRWSCGNRLDVNEMLIRMMPWLGMRRQEKATEALLRLSRMK